MQRTKEEVQNDLGSLEPWLYAVPDYAWGDYLEKHGPLRGDYTNPRVQATLVHQYMENAARDLFSSMAGFSMPPVGSQLFYLDYRHKYLIRLHLIYPDYCIAMNNTTLALDFADQGNGQLALSAMPEARTNLYLGYTQNLTHTGMQGAHLVYPSGPFAHAWEWTLSRPATGEEPVRLPRPDDGSPWAWPKVETQPETETAPVATERQDADAG